LAISGTGQPEVGPNHAATRRVRARLDRDAAINRSGCGTNPSVNVLVTGGGGFIGSHLVDRLLADGHTVRVLDSFATGRRENLAHVAGDVEIIEGDVQSYERAATATSSCEIVFHHAALPSVPRSIQDPLMSNAVNVTGTLNLLLAARDSGVRRIVYASSSSIYGASPILPKNEDLPVAPISPYAASKFAAENYCRCFTGVYGLECVALRYFNVFGPRQDPNSQYAAVIPRFIEAALARRRLTIFGDGEQSRDFTYVDNVVAANMLAIDSARAVGGVFNVACGERVSLNEVVIRLGTLLGRKLDVERTAPRPGEVPHSLADITRASEALGYKVTVRFNDGLRRTLEATRASRDLALTS